MTKTDFAFAVHLANTMNWNMATEDFQFNTALEPKGCFVLMDDAKRVGFVTSISFGSVGWFGNLIVKEDYRRKGAGTLLVKSAVEHLRSKGVKTVGLFAYKNLVDFYMKLGFQTEKAFAVMKAQKVLPINEKTRKISPLKKEEVPMLLKFDAKCFGAERKKLLEPIFHDFPKICFVAKRNNEVQGYVAAKVYNSLAEVGPLVSTHSKVATDLLQAALGRLCGLEVYLYASADAAELVQLAVDAGFHEEFSVVRMFMGSTLNQDSVYLAESLERG